MTIDCSYIVCATPRTGSGLLCDLCWRSGILGQPDEYFYAQGYHPEYVSRWGSPDFDSYIQQVRRAGTSPNGVFGTKIMWDHFESFITQCGKLHGYKGKSTFAILGDLFPNLSYIWLVRQDKVRLDISLFIRNINGLFSVQGTQYTPPTNHHNEFCYEEIDRLVSWCIGCDYKWETFFKVNGINLHKVVYEKLNSDPHKVLLDLLNFLKIPVPLRFDCIESDYQKLRDATIEDWVHSYLDYKK